MSEIVLEIILSIAGVALVVGIFGATWKCFWDSI